MKKPGKKLAAAVAVAAFGAVLALGLVGCGGSESSSATASGSSASSESSSAASSSAAASAATEKLSIAACPTPHAEILNDVVKPLLADEGIDLEVVEFTDYVQPNTVVEEGEIDSNYFQHEPYLDEFNESNGTHLVKVASVHYEPFGIYAGKDKSLTSLNDLPDGAVVGVPNDVTNEARALLLLEEAGLITLDASAGLSATKADIVDNPKNLDIRELEAATVPNTLEDVDIAGINFNYATEAGLSPTKDALLAEDPDSEAAQTYANLLVVKEGNENDSRIQALAKALNSEEVREYIEKNTEVIPTF